MVEIIDGLIKTDNLTKNAKGGTELQAQLLVDHLNVNIPNILNKFQIIHSRVDKLDYSKKRVLVLHDLPGDPMNDHLKNGGYNQFDKLVFVSNWQMQQFISFYSIPWYKCIVLQNAIKPLEARVKTDKIKLIYHTTPHRGLHILASVFDALSKINSDIELDVYSSFKIYGWEERDKQFEAVFDFCKQHEKINYFGSVSNDEVKTAVSNADIFAYPSIWPETSCISLIEAMSAGLLCVHSNLAALPETAANWTMMYQYQDQEQDHANVLYHSLQNGINAIRTGTIDNRLENQKAYTDMFYNWEYRALQWEQLLRSIL